MDITLPPDIERALIEQARRLGTTPELLAVESLRERLIPEPAPEVPVDEHGTLADFLRGHIGVLHSSEQIPGGARMSEATGRQFTEGLLKKRQQGRL